MTADQEARAFRSRPSAIEAARLALAYAALATGLVGTVAMAPLLLWGLVARGFH